MNVCLTEITRENWENVASLDLFVEQRDFVADPTSSLAEAAYCHECRPLAIYNGDELVGMLMYHTPLINNEDEINHSYWIMRLLIDKNHQRKGYGRAATNLLIDTIKKDSAYNKIYVSCEPANTAAIALYESMGFVPADRVIDDEIVYVLKY